VTLAIIDPATEEPIAKLEQAGVEESVFVATEG
jgi:hypothetical protein